MGMLWEADKMNRKNLFIPPNFTHPARKNYFWSKIILEVFFFVCGNFIFFQAQFCKRLHKKFCKILKLFYLSFPTRFQVLKNIYNILF